jgi:hypothetical protein
MPLPGTAHTVKVAVKWFTAGQNMVNTFYVRDATDAIFADLAGFGDSVNMAVAADLLPEMYAFLTLLGCDVEDIRVVPFVGFTASAAPGTGGALSATHQLPTNCTFSIKKITGGGGRSGRGRWYWVGMDSADTLTSDIILAARANAMITALVAFQTAIEAISTGLEMGIVSYYHAKVLRVAGLFEQITNWGYADLVLDSQRRRLPGRGR